MSPSARSKYLPAESLCQDVPLLSVRLCRCGARARYQPALWAGMGIGPRREAFKPLHRVPIGLQCCKKCRKKLSDMQLLASIWAAKVKDLQFGAEKTKVPLEECHLVWERC